MSNKALVWTWLGLTCVAPRSLAVGGSISHGAVHLTYDSTHWNGNALAGFTGVEPSPYTDDVYASGWWYSVGNTCAPVPPPETETYVDGVLTATTPWLSSGGRLFKLVETTRVIDDQGPSGTFVSTLAGQAFAVSDAPLTLRLFHYLDPDVRGTATGDTRQVLTPRYVEFQDGASVLRYRADRAKHFTVTTMSTLLAHLNDGTCPDLNDSGLLLGRGFDMQAAFEFEGSLVPGVGVPVTLAQVTVAANTPRRHVHSDLDGALTFSNLLFRYWASGGPGFWKMRGEQRYETLILAGVQAAEQLLARDDFDGDFIEETLKVNLTSHELYVGNALASASPPADWIMSSTGDFDGDGKADILWRDPSTEQLVVWTMDGAQKTGEIVSPEAALTGSLLVGAGDFDGDGHLDLLWFHSGHLVVWYMDATLAKLGQAGQRLTVAQNDWLPVAIGDYGRGPGGAFDTDDIVWENPSTYALSVWHMDHNFHVTSVVPVDNAAASAPGHLIGPR